MILNGIRRCFQVQTFFILIGAIILFLLIILLVFGAILFYVVCSRDGKLVSRIIATGGEEILSGYSDEIKKGQEILQKREKSEIAIKSDDGLNLHGTFVKGDDVRRTIICVHGYHGSPMHDFSLATEALLKCGNLLFVDQRSHGKSEGKYITFGVRECKDCKAWADFLSSKMGEGHPIYLDGVSMGGTTVLMASALELPQNVKGIIADCSFTSPYEIISCISKRLFKREPRLLIASVDLYCRVFAGFSLNENSTVRAMEKNRLPILFAHGTGDSLVPHSMSQAAYDACKSSKNIILAKDAEHGLSYVIDTKRYSDAIDNLFKICEKTA